MHENDKNIARNFEIYYANVKNYAKVHNFYRTNNW